MLAIWPVRWFGQDELCEPGRDRFASPEIWASLGALGAVILDPLREAHGHPIRVSSGFRDPASNKRAGGSPTSQHLLGQAADIRSDHATPLELARLVQRLKLPFDQIIVETPPDEVPWLHLSYGPRHRREALRFDGDDYLPLEPA